ncbi:MAG: hypothetical protein R3F61_25155 [Myxococcota bacterium]
MVRLLPAAVLLAWSPAALAWPYTPWTGATGRGVFAVNPYVELYGDGLDFNPWVLYGVSDRVDLIAGYTNTVDRPVPAISGPGRVDLLGRVAWSDAVIGALVLGSDLQGATDLGVELHGNWAGDRFLFTHNTGWSTTLGTPEHTLSTILAPEVRFATGAWAFVEGNPSVTLVQGEPGFALSFTPGMTAALDREENHLLTVALPVEVLPETSVTLGLCYWGAFPTRE